MPKPNNGPSPSLLALTASAVAALGVPAAKAQTGAPQVDYRYSAYRENDLDAGKLEAGSTAQRYEVDTHQFRLLAPLGSSNEFATDLSYETMSGASPWLIRPDASGKPVQVMSGASISDKRLGTQFGLTHHAGHDATTVTAGYSKENDYRSLNAGVSGEWQMPDTVTTYSAGASYASDKVEPMQGSKPTGTLGDTRHATSVFGGWSRVLDQNTVVQASLSYTLHDGYLSDPYKQSWVVSLANSLPDTRPDRRNQYALSARLRHYFEGPGAALHADYRWYHDDWHVDAQTLDLAWHQKLGRNLRLVPGVRYYSQSQASFYQPYYAAPTADGLYSSDYRLSPYGAIDASLAADVEVAGWGASLRYEHYDSSANLALSSVQAENPGLVSFDTFSVSFKKAF